MISTFPTMVTTYMMKKRAKEWLLVLGPGGESQEDELGDTAGLVNSLHGPYEPIHIQIYSKNIYFNSTNFNSFPLFPRIPIKSP